jgi:WD40 repeat protein
MLKWSSHNRVGSVLHDRQQTHAFFIAARKRTNGPWRPPDGKLVAAGSLETVVWIWDVNARHLVERSKGHKDSVYSVAFTPDGKGLVSGSLDKTYIETLGPYGALAQP